MTTTTGPSSMHQNVVPSEVGWQFVPQYYTFVNKQPDRLHCFYTKTSTFIHGTEGEDGKPCYGQQEIHNKITSIGFQDCKVYIHSVDAQSSANGGIIIQVIGEMSNHGEPWRKFVQTFFLAEQPNGYFVLNDIFRFLKEEAVDDGDASEGGDAEPAPAAHEPASVPVVTTPAAPEPVAEPSRQPTPPPAAAVVAPTPTVAVPTPAAVEEAPTTDIPEPPTIVQTPTPAPEPAVQPPTISAPIPTPAAAQPNGIHTPEADKAPLAAEKSPAPSPSPATRSTNAPSPAPPAQPSTPAAATAPSLAPATAPQPPVSAPAPTPSAPQAPRSWASLAASNSKKWGTAVAQESRGTTETPTSSTPPSGSQAANGGPPQSGPRPQHHQQHQQHHPHQHHGPGGPRTDHPLYIAAQSVTTPQCFIKGVTEVVPQQTLMSYLVNRFGPVKELEIVRTKACAFLEFQNLDSAKRAIVASLSQNQGGEGGTWLDVGGETGQVRIAIETRKERGDRPPTRPRGGAPVQGQGDGRSQGQGPSGGSGEGRGQGGYRGRGGAGRGGGGRGGGAK